MRGSIKVDATRFPPDEPPVMVRLAEWIEGYAVESFGDDAPFPFRYDDPRPIDWMVVLSNEPPYRLSLRSEETVNFADLRDQPFKPTLRLQIDPDEVGTGAEVGLLRWIRNEFRAFRMDLEASNVVVERFDLLAALLVDRLGALLQERDLLLDRLAAALDDASAAERRIVMLESQLETLRAGQGELEHRPRLTVMKSVGAIAVALLSFGGGVYAADAGVRSAEIAAKATVRSAEIAQETTLITSAVSTSAADGSMADIDEITAAVVATARELRDCSAD